MKGSNFHMFVELLIKYTKNGPFTPKITRRYTNALDSTIWLTNQSLSTYLLGRWNRGLKSMIADVSGDISQISG